MPFQLWMLQKNPELFRPDQTDGTTNVSTDPSLPRCVSPLVPNQAEDPSSRARTLSSDDESRVTEGDLDGEIENLLEELTATCLQDRHLSPTTLRTSKRSLQTFPILHSRRGLDLGNAAPLTVQVDNTDGTATGDLPLPELAGYIKICRPKNFGIRSFKRYYVALKGTSLHLYRVSVVQLQLYSFFYFLLFQSIIYWSRK